MRLSILKDDVSYSVENFILAMHCHITLDGVNQNYCVTADEELGMVERYKTDENGKISINGDGEAELEVVHGKVVITTTVEK